MARRAQGPLPARPARSPPRRLRMPAQCRSPTDDRQPADPFTDDAGASRTGPAGRILASGHAGGGNALSMVTEAITADPISLAAVPLNAELPSGSWTAPRPRPRSSLPLPGHSPRKHCNGITPH